MITLEEAQAYVLSHCQSLVPVEIPLSSALGFVTAAAAFAAGSVPPFANSAMDGYAVQSGDTAYAPVTLTVLGDLPAGKAATVAVGPGQAVKIMTGAPIPPGADAVVMLERCAPGDAPDTVVITETVPVGNFIRPEGDDMAKGTLAFPTGTELGAGHLGVLASIGVDAVTVYPKPRVGVLSTGDELADVDQEILGPGQIRDANRHTLLSLLAASGFEAEDLGIVRDDRDAITAAIEKAIDTCHVVLSSGGISVGDYDHLGSVLERLGGGTARKMQVAIKPSKPLGFAVVQGKPVFALPGNPVSAMVSFELFAFPALRRLMGHEFVHRRPVKAVADDGLGRHRDGKTHFVRVIANYGDDGRFHVKSSGGQGSHQLRSMADANALAILADGDGVPAGAEVDALLLSYR